jgi:hypothetical protein
VKVRLGQVARGVANAVEAGRYFETVHPTPDPSAGAYSAVVVMTGGTAQTYAQATLQYDVVLSAPVTDFLASLDWLSEGIEAVGEALRADPRCQGSCTELRDREAVALNQIADKARLSAEALPSSKSCGPCIRDVLTCL